MLKLTSEAAEIIDHITERIDQLKVVNKIVREQGLRDENLEGKIFAHEELRDWIAMNYL